MALSDAERKRRQREHDQRLGMKRMELNLATSERRAIADMAKVRGFDDQTEYLLSLVFQDYEKVTGHKFGGQHENIQA